MITNIQFLRAFAALAVAFYHSRYAINGQLSPLFGVEIFFCISGFVMVLVTRADDGRSFLASRIVRVVPLYWIATLAFYLWTHQGLSNPPYTWPVLWDRLLHRPAALLDWLREHQDLSPDNLVLLGKSLLFIPVKQLYPVLGVGWTLNLEMFFYAVFALALAVHRRYAPAIAGAVLLALKPIAQLVPGITALDFYASADTDFFILGMALYYAWRLTPERACAARRGLLATMLAAVTVAGVVWCFTAAPAAWVHAGDRLALAVNSAFPPAIVLLALWCHSAGLRCTGRFGLLLGAASYSLYLFHLFVMETLRPVGAAWPLMDTSRSPIALVLALALSVGLGVAVHLYIELPLIGVLRRRLRARRAAGAVVPA